MGAGASLVLARYVINVQSMYRIVGDHEGRPDVCDALH
jgi:hypothetical protein